jgi:hypothetical protein
MLIRRMSIENPLWGTPRIHGELLKLGFAVAQTSVAKVHGEAAWATRPRQLIVLRRKVKGVAVRWHRARFRWPKFQAGSST